MDFLLPLSKLFWLVAEPSSLLFACWLAGAALLWSPWYGLGRLMVSAAALASLAIATLPVGQWALRPLEDRFLPPTTLPGRIDGIIVLGGVMDELAMILLTLPVFFPIVTGLDFGMEVDDVAIWFGILVLIVVGIGMTCPPIGLNVFVVASTARDVPVTQIYKGVLPFVLTDIVRLGIVVAFPALSLYLVRLLG